MKTKKFTILHSNDIHGDFLAEIKAGEGKMVGGLSLLPGYINKFRKKEESKPEDFKECSYCCSSINIKAVKCPNCTAGLK